MGYFFTFLRFSQFFMILIGKIGMIYKTFQKRPQSKVTNKNMIKKLQPNLVPPPLILISIFQPISFNENKDTFKSKIKRNKKNYLNCIIYYLKLMRSQF